MAVTYLLGFCDFYCQVYSFYFLIFIIQFVLFCIHDDIFLWHKKTKEICFFLLGYKNSSRCKLMWSLNTVLFTLIDLFFV